MDICLESPGTPGAFFVSLCIGWQVPAPPVGWPVGWSGRCYAGGAGRNSLACRVGGGPRQAWATTPAGLDIRCSSEANLPWGAKFCTRPLLICLPPGVVPHIDSVGEIGSRLHFFAAAPTPSLAS